MSAVADRNAGDAEGAEETEEAEKAGKSGWEKQRMGGWGSATKR